MKKLLSVFLFVFALPVFATGISGTSAPCDNATLSQYSGTVNAEIDWEPNVIGITWYDGDTKLTVPTESQSCTYDNVVTVPPQPTKLGYTFNGWKVKKIMVPNGYTQLEYLQSTSSGGQYIDTGISPHSENVVYKASWLETTLEAKASLFGSAKYSNNSGTWPGTLYHPSDGQTYLAIAKSDHMCRQINITANQVNNVEIVISNGYFSKTQNGETCMAQYEGTVQTGKNISLFSNQGGPNNNEYCKYTQLFYWQMWDNGVLVRDMIPARRNSDNIVGMWDTVSQTFFTNAGSGAFTAGPTAQ